MATYWSFGYLAALGALAREMEQLDPFESLMPWQVMELVEQMRRDVPQPAVLTRDDVRSWVACPDCGAAPGEPCIYDGTTKEGRKAVVEGRNHMQRVMEARYRGAPV